MRNLLLPPKPILAINLGRRIKRLAVLQHNSPEDDHVAHDLLVMIRMARAVGAVVAVYVVSGIALVRVLFEGVAAFCECEGGFWDDLIEGKCTAGQRFTSVAVA
jgi:hypothetical protein